MVLHEKTRKKETFETPFENICYLDNRIGFWGLVKSVDSRNNTVTVLSDTGYTYEGIPVYSKEWVNAGNEKSYVTGSRNLPRAESVVFVLMPTRSITGAFVLCSGYLRGETGEHTLYAKGEEEKQEKNSIEESVSQGGWTETEDYSTGNKRIFSQDKNIVININPLDNEDKEETKSISLNAWENSIVVDENGISIVDSNNNIFTIDKNGIIVTDVNNNNITADKNGITVIDKNNSKIETTSNGINLYKSKDETSKNYIKLGSKIEMKGSSGTLELS